jgi:glutamate dehydrogenase
MGNESLIKDELLQQLEQLAIEREGAVSAPHLRSLLSALYASPSVADLLRHRPEHLLASATGLLRLAQSRKDKSAALRVYNPELERDGWHSNQTLIDVVVPDMPFIIDSLAAELERLEVPVELSLHVVFRVTRSATGELEAWHEREDHAADTPAGAPVSYTHLTLPTM